jgi:hypothetical protein
MDALRFPLSNAFGVSVGVALRGKGVRNLLPERPEGCFAQKVPDPNGTVVRKVWFGHELRYRCD